MRQLTGCKSTLRVKTSRTAAGDYPDAEAAAAEWVTMTTHSGTHLDAPYHFHSTLDAKNGEKKASITID